MAHRPAFPAFAAATTVTVTALALGLTIGLASALIACTPGGGSSDERRSIRTSGDRDGGPETVPVEAMVLEAGEIEASLGFSANLEAENQVQVLARAPGLVTRLLVEEGDRVERGQVLLRLEDEEQRIRLAQVDNDLAQTKRELERQKALHDKGVTSDQNLASAQYEFKKLQLMRQDAGRALRYTTVRAPITGTLTMRAVKLGQTVAVSQPLFDITDFDSLVARIFVPEKELSRLGADQKARIVARGTQHDGEVDRIAPAVDPQSGTVKVTIAVPRDAGLLPGMFVEVDLVVQRNLGAVLLPKRALVYDNEVPYAFKVEDGKARRVRVEPIIENRDFIEPVRGFAAGDQVIIAGQIGLKNDAAVEVTVRSEKTALGPTPRSPDEPPDESPGEKTPKDQNTGETEKTDKNSRPSGAGQ